MNCQTVALRAILYNLEPCKIEIFQLDSSVRLVYKTHLYNYIDFVYFLVFLPMIEIIFHVGMWAYGQMDCVDVLMSDIHPIM
jgi:hypothetical protein